MALVNVLRRPVASIAPQFIGSSRQLLFLSSTTARQFSNNSGEPTKEHMTMVKKLAVEGLMQMFCGLLEDGLKEEALSVFPHLKGNNGVVPGLVLLTQNINYAFTLGKPNVALMCYHEGEETNNPQCLHLHRSGKLAMYKDKVGEAKEFLVEMMNNQMKPNAATCVSVLAGLARVYKMEEGVQLVDLMKEKNFWPEEKDLRKALRDKTAPEVEAVRKMALISNCINRF